MARLIFRNARLFDGRSDRCESAMNVLVEGDRIQQVSSAPIIADGATVIDVGGRTLMPGMIDAHVHAFFSDISVQKVEQFGESYRTAHAARMLGHALKCGFTTVRDTGGGNYGLARALADGLIQGPRFFYSGKVLSMTGGHGEIRDIWERPRYESICSCAGTVFSALGVIADGIYDCVKATREELRQGAHFIKIMGSGGVASPTDPIWMNQYREDEIRAIVNECVERRTYATAHCHPAAAVRRCVEFGVRCIEHGTLMDAETADFVADRGAYVVPTLIILEQLVELGRKMGFPPQNQQKAEAAWSGAIEGLRHMRAAGVKVCFGTDLLGDLYKHQCREITLRSEVFTAIEILHQLTSIPAEMMMLEGQIGCISEGAFADLLVVDGDPLQDVSLLAADGAYLRTILRNGELIKHVD
ncbi:amidohydrolase family protein [Ramlibacter solisilvae]|uniref:Amidohydrolase n=1 Tax=Ramlibacter tataouinensis TaxID=94132 RepID=A0A127JUI3_9BURK|nr:amidohydrolase family protein [Ramlibacter tataouinensis]AMO23640.1 amidohydrolase [Ramlibacter tataouinensis]